ncbi:hypothetical protein E4T49_04197 [Aureobasidium sp. EXF-10728]|nr:hypothetical protein E4T49_04197 [Aureobasidium sp. EXF-10728]
MSTSIVPPGLTLLEKRALLDQMGLAYLNKAYNDLFAIHLGFPDGSHLPLAHAFPALPPPDFTAGIEQDVAVLRERVTDRGKTWHLRMGEDAEVVAEIQASVPDYDVDKVDVATTSPEEFKQGLESYWARVCSTYKEYKKCSDEEKKEFRKRMVAAAITTEE